MSRYIIFVGVMLFSLNGLLACNQKQTVHEKQKIKEESIIKGQELYLSYGCAVCHGPEGYGNGVSARNYDPPPTDFHNVKAYRYGKNKETIRNVIKYGVKGQYSAMPSFAHITDEELDQLAEFLISLQEKESQ